MQLLTFLSAQSSLMLWVIFLVENFVFTILALISGYLLLRWNDRPIKQASKNELLICILTNLINTAVTYLGFYLWQQGYIVFSNSLNWRIMVDFLLLFLLMDLAMFVFHYFIHHSSIYKTIHRFHHHYADPIPIDLFVLHPLETISFGGLWIIIIILYNFNLYAVVIYLIVNVLFGIVGHLGIEPLPAKIRNIIPFKYVGTSTFHHRHHLNIDHNFGFYTSLWDRLFGTFKP